MKLTNDKSLTAGKRGFLILFLSLLLPVGLFAHDRYGEKRGLAEGYLRLVPGASGGTVSLVQSSQG